MKTIFITMGLILLWSVGYCHHLIFGVVLNAEDQTPLIGSTIQVANSQKGTVTDTFGNFELLIDESKVTIIISYVGFKERKLEVSDHEGKITVLLEPSSTELSQLNITATGMNSINSISKLDLKLRPINSSQEVLRIVPGLFIAQHAGGGKAEQIFLRGFDTDHGTDINITVDGMPVNMVSHAHGQGYADLHFLIPELINVVDFGKGPYFSGKGNLTTAGYVGFTTKTAVKQNMIKVEGGRFDTYRTVGVFDLLGDKMNLKGHNAYAAVEYQLTEGPFENPQNFNRLNLFAKYTGYFDDQSSLRIQLSNFNSKWDASGQIPQRAVDDGTITRFGAIDPEEGGFTGRSNASIRLIKNLPSGVIVDNQLYFSQYDFELYSNFTFYLNDQENGDQIRQQESRKIFGLNGELSKSFLLEDRSVIGKIGYGFRYDVINDIELTNTVHRWTNIASKALGDIFETNGWIYADATYEAGNWLLNGGIRLDGFVFDYVDKLSNQYLTKSESKAHLSPKFNIIYHVNNSTRIYAKSGMGFHSNDTRVVVAEDGNEILPSAYGIDIGSSLKPTENLYVNMAFWYLLLDQEFVYVGDEAVVEPSGQSRRKGVDLSLRWQSFPWLYVDFDLNYAIPRAIDQPEGQNYIPLAPTLTSIGGLTFQSKNGLSGSLRYRYIKDRPANEDNSIVALGYAIADVKVSYSRDHYEIGLTVDNLFNSEWNEAQFATVTRLKDELAPVEDLTFTPGSPVFMKLSGTIYF